MAGKGKKISKEVRDKIIEEINLQVPYRTIAKKYGVSKTSVVRIKDEYDPGNIHKKLQREKLVLYNKMKSAAKTKAIIKRGDLLAENMINVGKIIIYGAEKLIEIVENSEKRVTSMLKDLKELRNYVSNCKELDPETEKAPLIAEIEKTISLAGNYYATNKILIEAVKELKNHTKTYAELEVEAKAIKQINEFTNAIFNGLNLIDDENYIKFRDYVIEQSELARQFFMTYDETLMDHKN